MTQVIYATRRSRAACVEPTEDEIKKHQWRKHIEETSRHLDTEPIQSEDLTFEQKEWRKLQNGKTFPQAVQTIQTNRDSVQVAREG